MAEVLDYEPPPKPVSRTPWILAMACAAAAVGCVVLAVIQVGFWNLDREALLLWGAVLCSVVGIMFATSALHSPSEESIVMAMIAMLMNLGMCAISGTLAALATLLRLLAFRVG